MDVSGDGLCTFPFLKDVVVAFVFFKLKVLVDHLKILINVFNLFPVKLLRVYEDCFSF